MTSSSPLAFHLWNEPDDCDKTWPEVTANGQEPYIKKEYDPFEPFGYDSEDNPWEDEPNHSDDNSWEYAHDMNNFRNHRY